MDKTHILPPDPGRMIEGLRDTGYEFNTAVADIIDNSIAADATLIDCFLDMDYRGNVRISIADNGIGMDDVQLLNAMKYGSQRRDDPASLGKFGLGVKDRIHSILSQAVSSLTPQFRCYGTPGHMGPCPCSFG